jgi:uncharacterized Zn finger protein
MAITRTWWGQRFIEALERFTDRGRLARGRGYAGRRIRDFKIDQGRVSATVEGNINPYFGVYKTPYYKTAVSLTPLAPQHLQKLIQRLSDKAGPISKLLMNELPEEIDDIAAESGAALLPRNSQDFQTQCSCPDYANPCKHVAGLCYRLAGELDHDPFLLFELRGLARGALREQLEKTPLGRVLAQSLDEQELAPQPIDSYYPRPPREPAKGLDYHSYWHGDQPLPKQLEPLPPPGLTAALLKRGGDYPPFWPREQSFIALMSELYERVRKNQNL